MNRPLRRLFGHLRLAPLLAVPAILARLCAPNPPPPTLAGVAQMLGEASSTNVAAGDFVWEASRGPALDAVFGRQIVFLGRGQPDAPRDVYRATVRVTLEGHPVSVERVVNLSESPFGDEQGLVGRGSHVAYATVAFGSVQQVTLLDLGGAPEAEGDSALNRLMAKLTSWQETGSFGGLGHTEISTNISARSVALALDDQALYVSIDGGRSRFATRLNDGSLLSGDGLQQEGVSSISVPPIRKPPIIWAVDTVREVTGPEPIAWLEEKTFAVRDMVKQTSHRAFGNAPSEQETLRNGAAAPPPPPPAPPSRPVGAEGLAQDDSWPPQTLRTIWEKPDPAEGEWRAPRRPFLKKNKVRGAEQDPPPYFMESYVRPDPERPYSKVLLVAMDSHQLQLGMEGGIEDPKPLTGARGEGRIPRDPNVLSRVVGAFNGAFKTTHGEYGMMVDRRVLLPPKPGAATVMITQDGRTGFGTWPESETIPQDMLSFRQNLEPLVEGQQLNPSNRKQWGWHLHGTKMLTHRSGLCVTSTGHMVYAWGAEVTGETLGRAMIQAGCVYAIHLDMNPHHTAFAYLNIRNPSTKDYDAELLTREMEVMPDRFILWSPKDFFYLTLRDQQPPQVDGLRFEADAGAQPAPSWSPAIWAAKTNVDGVTVRLQAIEQSRTAIRLGTSDSAGISQDESSRVLASVELAMGDSAQEGPARAQHDKRGARRETVAALTLSIDGDGALQVRRSGDGRGGGAISLPLLQDGKERTALAKRTGVRQQRAAVCVEGGRVWTARATATSYEPLVQALTASGCGLVGALDPEGGRAQFHRTGTASPPMDRYKHDAIYVVARPQQPGAFVWNP